MNDGVAIAAVSEGRSPADIGSNSQRDATLLA
jgi:hypothetical protein